MRALSRVSGLIALATLSGGFAFGAQNTPRSPLPTVECLQALRSARIARMRAEPLRAGEVEADAGAGSAELDRLLEALTPCGERIEWLQALLDHERRFGLPPEAHELVHEDLLARLADPAVEIPEAVADHLIYEPDLDPRVRAVVATAYQRRIAAQAQPSRRALQTLVHLLESSGRLDEAAAVLERLAAIDVGETSDWSLVRLYRQLERWPDAVRVTRRITARSELHANLFGPQLVHLLVRAGDPDGALHELQALEQRAGSSTLSGGVSEALYVSLAWELRDAGLDEQAERLFRRVLERPSSTGASLLAEVETAPGNAAEEAALAVLHLYAGDDERELLNRQAIDAAAGSEDPFELYESGTRALTSGKLEEAFALLQRAAPELPELEAAWYNLGLVAYRLDRFEAAAEAYGRANRLNPERADGWFFQGLALVSLERCADAIEPLENALRLDPARTLAHYHLGHCYHGLGRPEEGDRHLDAYQRAQGDR
ncbi:MAG TPA: tetratricopeptide repeat protein [Thermoanaerobaculia bacterium]|nr:tetratricopeptide repeat protein [Thermoanaerobaculia bacterium]